MLNLLSAVLFLGAGSRISVGKTPVKGIPEYPYITATTTTTTTTTITIK